MKALVLGGTYFIGKSLVELLLRYGWEVTILNRGTNIQEVSPLVKLLCADRNDHEKLKTCLSGCCFDVVYDISGYDRQSVEATYSLLDGKTAHYLFCSSIAVCRQPPVSWPISEDHDKCQSVEDGSYGYNKWLAEKFLFENCKSSTLITSVRPTYVYGPHNYHKHEVYVFEQALNNQPVIVSGDGENLLQFGYVDDLAEAFLQLTGNDKANGEAISVSGEELITVNQFISIASELAGMSVEVIHMNGELCRDTKVQFPSVHRFATLEKARKFGVKPSTDLRSGLTNTAKWWLRKKGYSIDDKH